MLNSHIHLDFDNVKTPSSSTTGVIIPSTGKDNWDSVIACCHSNKNSYFALGIHPWFVKDHQMIDLYDLEVNNIMQFICMWIGNCSAKSKRKVYFQ